MMVIGGNFTLFLLPIRFIFDANGKISGDTIACFARPVPASAQTRAMGFCENTH